VNTRLRALGEIVLRVKNLALEIDKRDYEAELRRLRDLGVAVTTFDHHWCHWRSIYVRDPEGNILELVCYDEAVA